MALESANGEYTKIEKLVLYSNGGYHVKLGTYKNAATRNNFTEFDSRVDVSDGGTLADKDTNAALMAVYNSIKKKDAYSKMKDV